MKLLPLRVLAALAAALSIARADGFDAAAEAALRARFEAKEKALDSILATGPAEVEILSQRGDARLFLGNFAGAVADFEKTIALDPALDAPHWRLGIAYYFAGDYAKSAAQFAKYHAYDGRDRENGVWKFLAQAKGESVAKARAEMLEYARFDREPFPALYEMFAGKKSGDAVFAEMKEKGVADEPAVAFFSNYYVGLQCELEGDRAKAIEQVKRAVDGAWARDAGGGPGYMWQVARLHLARLREKAGKP